MAPRNHSSGLWLHQFILKNTSNANRFWHSILCREDIKCYTSFFVFVFVRKHWTRRVHKNKTRKIRLTNSRKAWIWDQYIFKNMERQQIEVCSFQKFCKWRGGVFRGIGFAEGPIRVFPLYAQLPAREQLAAFAFPQDLIVCRCVCVWGVVGCCFFFCLNVFYGCRNGRFW